MATTEGSDLLNSAFKDSLSLRYMQIQWTILSGSKLPGAEIVESFDLSEFITLISKSEEGMIALVKFTFNDRRFLEKKHGGMEILEVKSVTSNSALARVLLNGPVAMLFCQNDEAWWVNPTYLTQNGMTLTIRGTKNGLRWFRDKISDLLANKVSIKLSAESLHSPEFVDMLPEKQRLVLDKAIEMGYYSRPRGCTQRDIAEVMNIKQATVSEHLQSAEAKIIHSISS